MALSATYYVTKSGSDAHECAQVADEATAKLTIASALECLDAGDTLYIKSGTYAEVIGRGQIPSGRPSAPTLVAGFPGDAVTLRPETGGVAGDAVWFGDGYSYITLRNLIIDAANVATLGIRFNESVHHIMIEDSEVKNAPASNCIGISGTNDYEVHHLTFRHLALHNCGATRQHHGIYIRGLDHVIENCEIYDNVGYGVHVYGGGSGKNDRTIIRNNRVHDNGGRGILIGSGDDHVAYNNIVWNNGYRFGGEGIQIYSGTPHHNQVYSNTVYHNKTGCISISSDSIDAVVKNNVCWGNGGNGVHDSGRRSAVSDNLTVP